MYGFPKDFSITARLSHRRAFDLIGRVTLKYAMPGWVWGVSGYPIKPNLIEVVFRLRPAVTHFQIGSEPPEELVPQFTIHQLVKLLRKKQPF